MHTNIIVLLLLTTKPVRRQRLDSTSQSAFQAMSGRSWCLSSSKLSMTEQALITAILSQRGRNALRHHSRKKRKTPRGGLWRRRHSSRDSLQRRDRRNSSRRILRRSPRGDDALAFSTFPATCLVRPPPQRLGVPRSPPLRDLGNCAKLTGARSTIGSNGIALSGLT